MQVSLAYLHHSDQYSWTLNNKVMPIYLQVLSSTTNIFSFTTSTLSSMQLSFYSKFDEVSFWVDFNWLCVILSRTLGIFCQYATRHLGNIMYLHHRVWYQSWENPNLNVLTVNYHVILLKFKSKTLSINVLHRFQCLFKSFMSENLCNLRMSFSTIYPGEVNTKYMYIYIWYYIYIVCVCVCVHVSVSMCTS